MKHDKKTKLKAKGWSEEEIRKTERILEKETKHDAHFAKIVFWSALIVIIFANLLISLILTPFLIVFNKWLLYSVVIILAATIGFLYNFLVTDIGHLEKKHHVLAGIIVPVIALANMVVMVLISNKFIVDIRINNSVHNPWIVSIVFAVAFILPYLLYRLHHHAREREKAVIVD